MGGFVFALALAFLMGGASGMRSAEVDGAPTRDAQSEIELAERALLVGMAAGAECWVRRGESREATNAFLAQQPVFESQGVWLKTSPKAQEAVDLMLSTVDLETCQSKQNVSDEVMNQQLLPLLLSP